MSKDSGLRAGSLLWQTLQTVFRRRRKEFIEPPLVAGALDEDTLRELLGKPNPVILEIGCNDGEHTRMFMQCFAEARIYAFEPDVRARARFESNIQDKRVQLFATAVGANDGITTFYPSNGLPPNKSAANMPGGWDLSGSIRAPKEHLDMHPWCRFDAGIDVAVTRLDSWRRQQAIGTVDFIWADVQGAEGDLIKGGRETLANTRYFYTEYNNRELYEGQLGLRELLSLLPDFDVVQRYPHDVLLRNRCYAARTR